MTPFRPPRGGSPTAGRLANQPLGPSDWFPVRLTGVSAGRYTGYEVWVDYGDTTVEAVGRRLLTTVQPGVFLGGDPGYTTDDLPVLALARLGPGAGGLVWELTPFSVVSGSGSGSGGGGSCTLETVTFDVVTGVSCDASGGLSVTTTRITMTGCNLSITAADAPACDPPSGTVSACTAGGVAAMPAAFEFTVGTFDNATYAALEGAQTVNHVTGCNWGSGGAACSGTGPCWSLTGDGSGWVLTGLTAGGDAVRYVVSGASAVGCAAVTMARDLADGSGVTEPATLTITPA